MAATITLLGPPGSGKGTQATRLRDRLGFEVLSTGDLLRTAREAGSDLGRSAAEFMDRGELVPDEVIVTAVQEAMEGLGDRAVLLDGFPRTVAQAHALASALGGLGRNLDAAILIDVPDEEVVRRIVNRHQGRADDTIDTARERLRVYHRQTEPLAEYYEERGLLRRIDGDRDADAVEDDVRAALR
ncbi:MAG TPA: adenylate kinase [Gemmatimonadales bacterium]|nr:adenylate kinase [Gemmatimonadales bacterium]